MHSSDDKHKQGITDFGMDIETYAMKDTNKELIKDKMIHCTRKRKAPDRLENSNDLLSLNKRPLCREPTYTRASTSQSNAYTWSPRACPGAILPQRSAETPPMAHTLLLEPTPLPPMASKPPRTGIGQKSLEQQFHLVNGQEGLVRKSNPKTDQQKVKESRRIANNVNKEDQTDDQQSENADRVDIGKAKNGKVCQNIDKSDKNPEYFDVNKVVNYKVPLKRFPRMHRLQGFVATLTNYCEGIENKLGLPNMGNTGMEHREYIDIFIQDNTFDMNLLIADHEDLDYTNTKIYRIASRERDVAGSKSVGLFVNSEGIQFVDSVTDSTIFVYSDSHLKKEKEQAYAIGSLMEVIIMRPLIGKVALFHRLRSIAHSEGNGEEFSAASLIREFPDLYPNSALSLITVNETTYSDRFYQCIQENKRNIERLLDEMIALSKRSNIPEQIKPDFEEYKTTTVSEEVARDLFKLDKAITWCGFRYRTFHIYVKRNKSEDKELAEKILNFLATHGIAEFELIYSDCDLEEYSYIGSKIRRCEAQVHHATLGCFATFKSSKSSSVCALISKHFARIPQNRIFDKDNRLLGRVLPNTTNRGQYDIAAAEIVGERVLNLDTNFRNYRGEVKHASLVERMEHLQGQSVYLRGAKTKLGVGTIDMTNFQESNGIYFIKVRPGSFTLDKPHARLAEEGDSGAILCLSDIDQNIYVCSMLIGKIDNEESFCFLPLARGLEELGRITNGEFKLITYMENSPAQIHTEGDYLQASGSCKYLT